MGCASSSSTQTQDDRRSPRNIQNQSLVKTNPYRNGSPITLVIYIHF